MFEYLHIQSAFLQDQLSGFDVTAHRQQGDPLCSETQNQPLLHFPNPGGNAFILTYTSAHSVCGPYSAPAGNQSGP